MPHSLSRCCPGETLVSSLPGDPFQGLGTGWRAFPLLNLPVIDPHGPTPSSAPSSSTRSQEPLGPHRHHLPHRRSAGRHLLRRRGTCLAAATRTDLEAFLADPLARQPAPTTRSSRSSAAGWPRKSDPTNPILSADSSPAWANILAPREDLNLRPSASHAGALSLTYKGRRLVLVETAGVEPAPSTLPATRCRLSYVPRGWCGAETRSRTCTAGGHGFPDRPPRRWVSLHGSSLVDPAGFEPA
jgi:hypothetical protein